MTVQQPEAHIKEPYTLAEIKAKIASHDYNAEMLLQHAMRLLEGAALSAAPTPTKEQRPARGEVYAELLEPDATTYGLGAVWNRHSMRDFADRTHALRMKQAAHKTAPGEPTQEFEKWLGTYSTLSAARDVNGYADLTTEMLWHAWQAAAKTKAPSGASAEWIDANARPGLALTNYTCAHDFSVQPSSGIRLCQKCRISETAARKEDKS